MYDALIKTLRETSADFGELDNVSDLLIEAADAIEELSKPRWIPVTEALPENNTRVIGFMAWKAMTAVERQHNRWYSIDHLEPLQDEAVTHWMPLPEPPKEET